MPTGQDKPGSTAIDQDPAVVEHLFKLREKLLDLTSRNRLLSFKHSSTNCIRAVDELPDQIFSRLVDGESLFFKPVPEPTEAELKKYYLDGSRVPRVPNESEKFEKPKAEVWARYKGLATDYELPVEVDSTEREGRHDDSYIQTLWYPQDLERRLRKLYGDARTAVEESGVNMLYLSFGFLEWKDEKSIQEKSSLAPAFLVPVELKRTTRGKTVEYALSWTGEDIQQNISLAKKLERDFGLILPEIVENESVEKYLARIRSLTIQKSGWNVRRFVSLSLFNFGKLLLYLDLDPQRWPANKSIAGHSIVKGILGAGDAPGSGSGNGSTEPIDHEFLDLELPLVDRADSSQAEALKYALSGKSLVIQGPPGTGKSQTITNLIAAALADNKSVLFISDKLAALEVVRRRLRELGLGEFCLELHSNKTRKLSLIKDLEERLSLESRLPSAAKLKQLTQEHRDIRQSIQAYTAALGRPVGALGQIVSKILFEAGRKREALGSTTKTLKAPSAFDAADITQSKRTAAHRYFQELKKVVQKAGGADHIKRHPWKGVSASKVLAPDAGELASLAMAWASAADILHGRIKELAGALACQLDGTLSQANSLEGLSARLDEARAFKQELEHSDWFCRQLEAYLGIRLPSGILRYKIAVALVELAACFPFGADLRGQWLWHPQFDEALSRISSASDLAGSARATAEKSFALKRRCRHRAAELHDAAKLLRSRSPLKYLSKDWREAKSLWDAYARADANFDPDHLSAYATVIEAHEMLQEDAHLPLVLGQTYRGLDTDIKGLREAKQWVEAVNSALRDHRELAEKMTILDEDTLGGIGAGAKHGHYSNLKSAAATSIGNSDKGIWQAYLDGNFPKEIAPPIYRLSTEGDWTKVIVAAKSFDHAHTDHVGTVLAFTNRSDLDLDSWFFGDTNDQLPHIAARARQAADSPSALSTWLSVQSLLDSAPSPGCLEIAHAGCDGTLPIEQLSLVYDFFLYDGLARLAFSENSRLSTYRGHGLDTLRESFRQADEAVMDLRRVEIARKLVSKNIPQGTFSQRVSDLTEMHLLRNEIAKQKRHIPIRKLIARAGHALQALKPCFMMGPLSVAQYLEPGKLSFDLIIMDEASQLRPEDAVGALARGKQAIIVGDPKQLPPTSFFDTLDLNTDGSGDSDGYIAQMSESVLDLAQLTLNKRLLRWHYRSRHPALIQFSNKEFYNGELVIFPSPVDENDRYGITFEHVPNGIFAEHVNVVEAQKVASAAVEHLRAHPGRSLGVVAMNLNQKEQIEAEVERLLKNDPLVLQVAEDRDHKSEPFFVKNLENVQGDERDVIIISMTYGPSASEGKVPQRFGPINQDAGWRRLNVLFTRAKERMIVFSSMRADDILLADSPARGPAALKAFLKFAESGRDGRATPTTRDMDSDFEAAVVEALELMGHNCVTQLGVAGFFIDIAVRDPDKPEEYLLGIECDGASYHSTKSARDRDRLRQDILEDLGWQIERVWSMDWFQDPSAEASRLNGLILSVLELRRGPKDKRDIQKTTSRPATFDATVPHARTPDLFPTRQEPAQKILSMQDAREMLIELREKVIKQKFPDVDPAKGILRRSLLDQLLKSKPISISDFQQKIPLYLRSGTDGRQLSEYGEQIFDILERVEI